MKRISIEVKKREEGDQTHLVVSVPGNAGSDTGRDSSDGEEDTDIGSGSVRERVDGELDGKADDDDGHPEDDEETAGAHSVGVEGGEEGGDEAEDCGGVKGVSNGKEESEEK